MFSNDLYTIITSILTLMSPNSSEMIKQFYIWKLSQKISIFLLVNRDLRAQVTKISAQVRINDTKSLHEWPLGQRVQRFGSILRKSAEDFCHDLSEISIH